MTDPRPRHYMPAAIVTAVEQLVRAGEQCALYGELEPALHDLLVDGLRECRRELAADAR